MSEYVQQAKDFLKKTNTKMTIVQKEIVDHFPGETKFTGDRWRYKVTLSRNHKSYTFDFYDSIHNYYEDKRPTQYDVLACLETYEVVDDPFEFGEEYGFEIRSAEDAKRLIKTHKACQEQYKKLRRLFGKHMEELREIM